MMKIYMKDAVEDGILMEFWDVDLKGEKMRKVNIQQFMPRLCKFMEFTSQCRRIVEIEQKPLLMANHKMVLQQ